jgi:RecB family exonuclease
VALEVLWRELKTQQALKDLLEEERSALIRRSVRTAMDRTLKGHASAVLQRLQGLEEERLDRLLQQWLRIEADRPPFEISDTETTTTAELGGLKLHIKADRVDRYADGRHAILDYKTSKNLSLSGWESERPDAPQLPLYAAMSQRPISSVLFAKLVAGEPALVGISESGEQAGRQPQGPPLTERIQGWRVVMEALATSFRQGYAAVDPKKGKQTCQYCDLTPLCRIGELSRGRIKSEKELDE